MRGPRNPRQAERSVTNPSLSHSPNWLPSARQRWAPLSPPRLSRLVVGKVTDNEGSLFTVTLVLGLIFVGMGGFTIFTLPGRQQTAAQQRRPAD